MRSARAPVWRASAWNFRRSRACPRTAKAKLELRIRNERQRAKSPASGAGVAARNPNRRGRTWTRSCPRKANGRGWPGLARRSGAAIIGLNAAYVEGGSPLGFWAVRKTLPVQSEIRVYPNLLNERKNLAALFLNRGAFGLHAQRQVGKGRDFEKLREYVPGDGYDEIHWKAPRGAAGRSPRFSRSRKPRRFMSSSTRRG